MKKKIILPRLKNYFSLSKEYSGRESFFHYEVQNFNLVTGLVFIFIPLLLLSFIELRLLAFPLAIFMYCLVEGIKLYVFCDSLSFKRIIKLGTFTEGDKIEVEYKVLSRLSLDFEFTEHFDGTSVTNRNHKFVSSMNTLSKTYHLDQGFGDFFFNEITISCTDLLGLFKFKIELKEKRKIKVEPYIQKLPFEIHKALNDSLSIGEYDFVNRGVSPIFYGLREYRHGDAFKFINWKVSTKHNKLLINEFENIQNITVNIYLCTKNTEHMGLGVSSTWEYTRDICLSLIRINLDKNHLVRYLSESLRLESSSSEDILEHVKRNIHSKDILKIENYSFNELFKKELLYGTKGEDLFIIRPLYYSNELVNLIQLLIDYRTHFGDIRLYLVDAFDEVEKQVSNEFVSRMLSEKVKVREYIENQKKTFQSLDIKVFIINIQKPHVIKNQLKKVI